MPHIALSVFVATEWQHIPDSSSLRPWSNEFTCEKWFTGYKFGIENGTESKFGTNKELIVLKILKFKYCVNKSRDMWPFFYEKSLIIDKLVIGTNSSNNIFHIHIKQF